MGTYERERIRSLDSSVDVASLHARSNSRALRLGVLGSDEPPAAAVAKLQVAQSHARVTGGDSRDALFKRVQRFPVMI